MTGMGGDCVLPPPPEPIEFRQPVGRAHRRGLRRPGPGGGADARARPLEMSATAVAPSSSATQPGRHRPRVFHMATAVGLACASCHPEGGEDGRIWSFAKIGPAPHPEPARRHAGHRPVPLGRRHARPAPADERGVRRPHGRARSWTPTAADALASWLDRLPAMPGDRRRPTRGRGSAGEALFDDAAVGCATCHSGAHLTNNPTVAVGTGAAAAGALAARRRLARALHARRLRQDAAGSLRCPSAAAAISTA